MMYDRRKTQHALYFHESSEFLLLEIRPDSEAVVSWTHFGWETVVIRCIIGGCHDGGCDVEWTVLERAMATQKGGIGGCKDTEARSVTASRASLSLCLKNLRE